MDVLIQHGADPEGLHEALTAEFGEAIQSVSTGPYGVIVSVADDAPMVAAKAYDFVAALEETRTIGYADPDELQRQWNAPERNEQKMAMQMYASVREDVLAELDPQ